MRKLALLLPVVFLLISPACKKDNLCDPTPKFNIDLFVENVEKAMTNVSGYQFTVNQNGNLYYSNAEGISVHAVDPGGPIAMTVNTRMNVASVSKFIGTIALMQVLEKKGIDIDQMIQNYLPDSWRTIMHSDHWDAGSSYKISFKNLLRMETGLQFSGTTWSPGIMPTAQQMLDALLLPAAANRWGVYQNGNFTLIRVLIGEMEYNLNESAPDYDQQLADKYYEYIKLNIFDKLNLTPPMSVAEINAYYTGNFTRGHQWPFDDTFRDASNQLGWPATSDPVTNGGSGGLVLSSIDLATILAFFSHDNTKTIISVAQKDLILENELGLTESLSGEHGRYTSKRGTRGPENTNSRALRSAIMFFPFGIEAVILSNCNISTLGSILRDSYDDAWVSPC